MLIQYIIKPYPWCTVVSMEEVWKWLDRHQPFIDYNPPFVIWLFGVFVPEHKTRIGQHIEEPTIQIYTNSIKKTLNTDIYLFIRLLPHSLLVNLTPLLINTNSCLLFSTSADNHTNARKSKVSGKKCNHFSKETASSEEKYIISRQICVSLVSVTWMFSDWLLNLSAWGEDEHS